MTLYLLYENSTGYSLFERIGLDEVGAQLAQVQEAVQDYSTFKKICKLKAFSPFPHAERALENMKSIAKSEVNEDLASFLEVFLTSSKEKKPSKFYLGVQDKVLAGNISTKLGYSCKTNEVVFELFRGIRLHFTKYLAKKDFSEDTLAKSALGLGHAFSRFQNKTDVNRQDKHIIQSISLLELMDKNLNLFAMRIKEWFSWHFPELGKVVTDNHILVRCIKVIQNRDSVTEETKAELEEILGDSDMAAKVLDGLKSSMGRDMSELDTAQLSNFCDQVLKQYEYRVTLQQYIKDKMNAVAPSLTAFIGENVGAKLICQAGSMVNLAKYPASTVQILGAEKALFRALKNKGNTPKYGILFNSSYIGKALVKDKGKISRYIANKCSLAARIDQFSLLPNARFGDEMKVQVEERLKFLETGVQTRKNADVMLEVLDELKAEGLYVDNADQLGKKKKKKKAKVQKDEEEEEEPVVVKKKKKVQKESDDEEEEPVETKKKKKTKL
mmetsp:Transcript_22941/g.26629  ORF Transcript_22941/g.26629 Transcript_22941/m.26629 type:complete len:499 (+) Transcript_22941:30-1526(+)|eukprot:CAMPEP_0176448780 /NCGR_PEP_ID=MMETSP0127-20121128/26028_1 /TAXON_ID=938130 /ORGANISM="Platyophrya macrostoma, Strain WH" /LENGTH=498 /DNA_ID=CAMNT_0017835877 /DNA_START=30 /DNA_END=1526 /DNA_ORIENTATION=+